MAWNYEGDRVWVQLSDSKDTRAWVKALSRRWGGPRYPRHDEGRLPRPTA